MTAINTRTVAVLSSTDTLGVPMETLVNQALSIRSFCLSGLTVLPWCLATTFML
ncbi:hypothetical protein BJY04DRAFT_194043 [Aspergillus karnatakaensis]|uniref:uncharacterized protein n=1 Tax=Aspergillus karnatakaensis TaxID=1810916 RepID=UPI003CCDA62A